MTSLLQNILGATSLGVVATVSFLKILEVITRHGILLTGQCVERASAEQTPASTPVYRYRIRLQNLESVAAEQPFEVKIMATTIRPLSASERARAVVVLAGWKPYTVQRMPTTFGDNEFNWHAVFPFLPTYDTWSFEVVLPSESVTLSIRTSNSGKRLFIAPQFGQYFEPDAITVFSTDSRAPRTSGPIVFPRPVLALVLSLLAVSVHMLFAGLKGWQWSIANWAPEDGGFVAGELLFIWAGYALMRRKVYPVIQGYRFATPPGRPNGAEER